MKDALTIETWAKELEIHFLSRAPDLSSLLNVYSAEAKFGRRYLDDDLVRLPQGARIIEIGAGSFILACQLKSEGYDVTGLEPISEGFSHFERMRALVIEYARERGIVPDILECMGEELNVERTFDFAYSLNVMEHVADVGKVIENVGRALKPGGTYRFTCPNYHFPYEPHFNIPTLFSKSLTRKVFDSKIRRKADLLDPEGIWSSLNWITTHQVRRIVARLPALRVQMNTGMLANTFERLGTDQEFASRRSAAARRFLLLLVRLRIHRLFWVVPASIQPIIDCKIIAGKEST